MKKYVYNTGPSPGKGSPVRISKSKSKRKRYAASRSPNPMAATMATQFSSTKQAYSSDFKPLQKVKTEPILPKPLNTQ